MSRRRRRHRRGRSNKPNPQSTVIDCEENKKAVKPKSKPKTHRITRQVVFPDGKYYVGKTFEDAVIVTTKYIDAKKLCAIGNVVFDQDGIRIYPHPPMICATKDEFYYVATSKLSLDDIKKRYSDLSTAINICSELGSAYNVYERNGNRVY